MDFSILESIDAGVAIFDADLTLIKFNTNYKALCGYSDKDLYPGASLIQLIRSSMEPSGFTNDEIDKAIDNTVKTLQLGGQKFNFKTRDNNAINITRNLQSDGKIIETVHKLRTNILSSEEPVLEKIAQLAHRRMMIAFDAIGDGFAVYDADDRLTVYNEKYVELNPQIADLIKPGAQYSTMLRKGIERGGIVIGGFSHDEIYDHEMQRHQNPGESYDRQLKDGRWIRIVEKRTEDGGIAGIRSDITELKNREIEVAKISNQLDNTTSQFSIALNNMIQGLCMFDKDQRLILCNKQYLNMYGFSPDIVKPGILLSDIMKYSISLGNYKDEDAEAALKARHNPKKLQKRTTIKQYLRDGRVMAVMNEPMGNGNTIATYQDITTIERHEEQLQSFNEKLSRSNKELQEFAYVASHDLQEPLRKIEAFSDRLSKKYSDILPDDGKVFVDRMQNAAFRMRQLINDLLSYSRVTTNAREFSPVNLNEIIEGVLSDIQIRLQEVNGTVNLQKLPEVDADQIQMRQLFQNLISNALKFKKPDVDPIIEISGEEYFVENSNSEKVKFWRIKIADNGIGFENKYKDQIFTIFQRLHGRMEYEGTGIGLATCRKIIERHNGAIDAEGVAGEGATFIIDFPAYQHKNQD